MKYFVLCYLFFIDKKIIYPFFSLLKIPPETYFLEG